MVRDDYKKRIEETWDEIADSFDATRKKPWRQCLDFINTLPSSSMVVDLGCGNGRHLLPCADQNHQVIGFDISTNLLHLVQKKIPEKQSENVYLIHGDLVHLPFKENTVDAILYVAALHNIKGRKERVQSLREARNILKNEGQALISVWSRWQQTYRKFFFKQLFLRKEDFGDITIYWKQHRLNTPRFYHLYSKKEFRNDLTDAGFVIETVDRVRVHARASSDNYFALVKKK